MNKLEELKQKYKELGEEIEKLEKQGKWWKPQKREEYYTIYSDGTTAKCNWYEHDDDQGRYGLNNCFKTKEEAEMVVEKRKIYTQLKRLAEEINIRAVDWSDSSQKKYYIAYRNSCKDFAIYSVGYEQQIGVIYSTNPDFLMLAKELIGEENLLKLFKE